ncbi:P63C domain-containing protein [Rhodoplanes sp. Z2-YC6860]|uniref:P63C domain-containing protein n=1 Tax=Rhodoplanes sp. Z2-YC6860 TaxID=674703 RepID=UPI00078D9F98|nr:P63C domain-containing protein [Rhodoplanes sp. Z2-YC6860]AMN39704.1 phage protein [Rhodoplanes sp. Z2-YC6860]
MADTPQSKGGLIRAETLSPNERRSIARRAAAARWKRIGEVPEASHQGSLTIGDIPLDVYVLDDGRRLFHKKVMGRALGLKSEGGNAFMKTLSSKSISSAISEELWAKIRKPVIFKAFNGELAHGYESSVLIDVCEAIIEARNANSLTTAQAFLAIQAEIIFRAAAKLGIVALIDEATGYSDNKRKDEYRELFQAFIRSEFRQWESEFPDKFFDMIYKLYGLKRKDPKSVKHPIFFSKFIRKYVYHPLANSNGAILEELEKKNPVVYASGGRRYKLFQFLSDEIGLPALKAHLWQVVGIGSSVQDKISFDKAFYRAFPEALPKRREQKIEFEQVDLFSNLEDLSKKEAAPVEPEAVS